MKFIYRTLVLTAILVTSAPLTAVALSNADVAGVCKAHAQSQYGQADHSLRVKFKGMSGGGLIRKVRMQILPEGGQAFNAVCEINTRTQGIAALTPTTMPEQSIASAAR